MFGWGKKRKTKGTKPPHKLTAASREPKTTPDQKDLQFRVLAMDLEVLKPLWKCIQPIERPWDAGEGFALWLQTLGRPDSLFLEVLEGGIRVGLVSLTNINVGQAIGHATYWDKRTRGRERDTLGVLVALMRALGLGIVRGFTPVGYRFTGTFLKRMGWKKEGLLRRAIEGRDAVAHSVLLEEAEQRLFELGGKVMDIEPAQGGEEGGSEAPQGPTLKLVEGSKAL